MGVILNVPSGVVDCTLAYTARDFGFDSYLRIKFQYLNDFERKTSNANHPQFSTIFYLFDAYCGTMI